MATNDPEQELYLIGHTISEMTGRKLPTNKQVLQLLFDRTRNKNLNLKDSITDIY